MDPPDDCPAVPGNRDSHSFAGYVRGKNLGNVYFCMRIDPSRWGFVPAQGGRTRSVDRSKANVQELGDDCLRPGCGGK